MAEEIIFGYVKVTSGASSDIKMATNLAKAMATQYGMSDKLGPLAYGDNEEEVFLGHSVARSQNMSDDTQRIVDQEVHNFVLEKHLDQLHIIGKGLLEYETLSGKEINDLLKGKLPIRDYDDEGRNNESAVPSAGEPGKKDGDEPEPGGMEPQPS